MNVFAVRNLTGCAGLVAGVTVVGSVPLYFIYSGAPPAWNVLTRDLITLVTCGAFLVFVAGLCHLARCTPSAAFPALVAAGAGFVFVAIALMATSLEAGVVFGTPDGTVDPTIDGPLAQANMLAHGPIKRLLTVIFLVAAGFAAAESQLWPKWLRVSGYIIALVNLAFVPSLYFGTDPTDFYAVHSWANSAVTGSLLFYWVIAASIVLVVRSDRHSATES